MERIEPVVQAVEPDKYDRNVKVGIRVGTVTTMLPAMTGEEVRKLRNALTRFLMEEPFREMNLLNCDKDPSQAKVGDIVKVRFEEFGMPDKHIPVSITFNDGSVKQIIFDSIQLSEDGKCTLVGQLTEPTGETTVQKPIDPSIKPIPQEETTSETPYIRSYMFRSALVRFFYEGRMHTAAITHCTDKAWRIINTELGVAWVPKNAIRWSEVAQQFCIVDDRYKLNFTFDVKQGMDEYPSIFNPNDLIMYELEY